jgi:MFS family permease
LLAAHGLRGAMLIYSAAFALAVCALAQLLVNPPVAPALPAAAAPAPASPRSRGGAGKDAGAPELPPQILRTPTFYLLWVIYFIGAGAGLMVISSISGMAKKSLGDAAFVAVAVMAIGNAAGRIGAGLLSDRIGRRWTLMLVLLIQAILMFVAIPVVGAKGSASWLIVLLATLIGFNYGANLSLFPSYTKDLWGLKSFGMNYGILFTAWGVGGFVLSRLQQMLTSQSGGDFSSSFGVAGALLLAGAALTLAIKPAIKT